ncbi:MAG: Transglutaminase-like superfamily protein [Fibrobacteria bacterium]|jgi:hypothetical protein|nr:Transglutaminase-like superfamily protein [Fibrobacteria bacterium]
MFLHSLRASLGALVLAGACSHAAPSEEIGPRETLVRFDSLLQVGAAAEARALCTGQALRLLPLLIETQEKLAAFMDTAKSSDTVLEEKARGDWTALKVRSVAVFTRPLMGLNSLTSIQAVHLFRDEGPLGKIWKVADFEELASEKTALVLRQGVPSADGARASFLPISRRVPVKPGATRLRLRLSLRGGDSLPGALPGVVERGASWALVETRRASLPDSLKKSPGAPAVYLASTPDLDLTDPLLRAKAAALKKGAPHAVETTRRIYGFVATSFQYKLGATLFGTSREALRGLKGDCSEAAVLTAALLRAAGIPSRVTLGFATLDRGVFIGHAWAEAWIGGAWVGVDPALRQFPAGADRVALLRLSGEKRLQPLATNLMMRTLANLEIEITEAWIGEEKLELRTQSGADKEVRAFLDEVLKGMSE